MGGEADSIIERVIEYCRSVDSEFRLKRVVLFGSRSRGDFYPHSDIDLLLVSDEFPDDWFTRQAKLYFLKLKQIEPIGYTTTEIRGMIEEGNKFIENIFQEGKDIELNMFRVRSMKKHEEGGRDDWDFCSCCLPQSTREFAEGSELSITTRLRCKTI